MPLRPVVRKTSAQSVADQLFAMIREGAWKVGDRLPSEKELSETLGVGRSTVREALQNLMAVNVIESGAGLRTIIKSPTPREIFRSDLIGHLIGDRAAAELLEARAMIEPDCARLASVRASDDDLDRVEALLDRHAAALAAGEPIHEFGAAFHVEVARCARNRVVESFMTSILDVLTERSRRADAIAGARAREVEDHRRLLAVLRARDPDAAREAMLQHILDWADSYQGGDRASLSDVAGPSAAA